MCTVESAWELYLEIKSNDVLMYVLRQAPEYGDRLDKAIFRYLFSKFCVSGNLENMELVFSADVNDCLDVDDDYLAFACASGSGPAVRWMCDVFGEGDAGSTLFSESAGISAFMEAQSVEALAIIYDRFAIPQEAVFSKLHSCMEDRDLCMERFIVDLCDAEL